MNNKYVFSLTIILAFMATITVNVEAARRIKLRPLSAKEVVRILKAAGREDAIPEGRVVSQGIAAMTGFALGLTKGIGGALLVDLATSNATTEFINNFNYTGMMADFQGINMTALMQMIHGGSATDSSGIKYQTTEICFSTRVDEPISTTVGRSLRHNSEDYEDDDEEMARQATVISPAATSPDTGAATDAAAGTGTGTGTADTINTGTGAATGTATGTNTDTGTGSVIDTGTVSDSKTNTLTQTGTGAGVTCIVIEKPKLRKRRALRGRRRLRSPFSY